MTFLLSNIFTIFRKNKHDKLKNITLISSTFINENPGGVQTYVDGRANYLSKKLNVTVFALGKKADIGSSRVKNICLGTYKNSKFFIIFIWIKLLFFISTRKTDYIEIHNIPVAFPLFFLKKCTNHFHGPAVYESRVERNSFLHQITAYISEYLALRFSKKTNVDSPAFINMIFNQYPFMKYKQRILIKKPKIKSNQENTKCSIIEKDDTLRLVCVRRLIKRTGVSNLIIAFNLCLDLKLIDTSTQLYIIGDGPEFDYIQSLAKQGRHSTNIIMLGKVSNTIRDNYYKFCDWNIVPTIALEGFGLVVLEAASFGCPSLVTNIDALPYVINQLSNIGSICNSNIYSLVMSIVALTKSDSTNRALLINQFKIKYSTSIP